MTDITPPAESDDSPAVTDEDRVEILAALKLWQAQGVVNPLIPVDVDLDGDGIHDAFGLDENGELVVVSGVTLDQTTYASTGDPDQNLADSATDEED